MIFYLIDIIGVLGFREVKDRVFSSSLIDIIGVLALIKLKIEFF